MRDRPRVVRADLAARLIRIGPASFGAALLLAGCAVSPDPAEGGFISGVSGLSSGSYDRRVRERSSELERLRAQQAEAEASAAAARSELSQRQQEVRALKVEIAQLDRALAEDQARAARRSSGATALAARNRRLQGELATARADLAKLQQRLGAGVSAAEYAAVQRQYRSLQAAISTLQKQLYGG